jgi:hypothetical protein
MSLRSSLPNGRLVGTDLARFPEARFWTGTVRLRFGEHSKEVFHTSTAAALEKPSRIVPVEPS